MAVTTTTVTGSIAGPDGVALVGTTVKAYATQPLFYSDGTLIPSYEISTTTDASGAWSLTLVETTSISKSLVIAFELPTGSVERIRHEYTVVIPASGPVTFYSLAGTQ